MAEKFKPQTFDINSINGGNKFNLSDGILPEAVNAPIEATAFVQSLATNQPNISEIDGNGEPSVSIENTSDGTPRFKFANLKSKELSEQVAKNKMNIDLLFSIGEQTNQFYKATVEDEFVSRVTAGGLNVVDKSPAIVQEIKGKTVKCENLIPFPYTGTSSTINGITWNVNDDGSITANGTATATSSFVYINKALSIPSIGKYTFSGATSQILGATVFYNTETNTAIYDTGTNSKLTVDLPTTNVRLYSLFRVSSGVTVNNVTVYPMLNKGETALPYQPYFTGLKHANINAIKSTGTNTEEIYQLPETVELKEWESIYPQRNERVNSTRIITFDGTENWSVGVNGGVYTTITDIEPNSYAISNLLEYSDEGYNIGTLQVWQAGPTLWSIMFYTGMTEVAWKAYLAELNANGNPLIVAYKTNNPTVSEITAPKYYIAENKGTETVIQGTTDNSSVGANPTITNQYYVLGGKPNES